MTRLVQTALVSRAKPRARERLRRRLRVPVVPAEDVLATNRHLSDLAGGTSTPSGPSTVISGPAAWPTDPRFRS